ncbi:hypothetical protein A5N15_11300 [Rothia kristinae]|uniref:Uncharacterized protein n=1 Tax=Rothia kristinae TaxID=37923 RepID=A0A657IT32_9MICC|nr:hypothetical protein A5N15_11300 [Rothia kristinae]
MPRSTSRWISRPTARQASGATSAGRARKRSMSPRIPNSSRTTRKAAATLAAEAPVSSSTR